MRIQFKIQIFGLIASSFFATTYAKSHDEIAWASSLKGVSAEQPSHEKMMEQLKLEVAALNVVLSHPANSQAPITDAYIQREISKRNKNIRILDLQKKIELCDYTIATKKDLHLWKDQTSHKNGLDLVQEERAHYQAELDQLRNSSKHQ